MRKLLILFLVIFPLTMAAQSNQRYISVNGTSERTIPADQIDFDLQIEVIDESVEKSKTSNDEYLNELLTILDETGIKSDDVNVSPIMIGRNYEQRGGERILAGFYTRVNVSFLLKDLSKYYELTNKLASSNHFEIVNSSYSISDYEEQNKLTYIDALKAAREKAEYMAETMGVKILDVLEITDNNMMQPYAVNTLRAKAYGGGGISGKVELERSVNVKFAID